MLVDICNTMTLRWQSGLEWGWSEGLVWYAICITHTHTQKKPTTTTNTLSIIFVSDVFGMRLL